MRIIAGKYRGRILTDSSKLKSLRPTTDKNRESLFNLLNSSKALMEIGFDLKESILLDVFCGTGAVAFEALSRGISKTTAIDNNSLHLEIARQNAQLLKETNINFLQMDVLKTIPQNPHEGYSFIYLDPPYSQNMAEKALDNLDKSGWIKDEALIVIEYSADEEINLDEKKFKLLDRRKYGITVFDFRIKLP